MALPIALLGSLLLKIGAPIAGSVLNGIDTGSPIANSVLKGLGGLLGVEPNAKVILDTLKDDPDAQAKVSAADSELQMAMTQLGQMQLMKTYDQWQREGMSEDRVQRWWRPILAYGFGLQTMILIVTFCTLALKGQLDVLKVFSDVGFGLSALIAMYFTGMFGILGVFIMQRTSEKNAQAAAVANSVPTNQMDVLQELVKSIVGKK